MPDSDGELLDWTEAHIENEFVAGSTLLTLNGVAPYPMRVWFDPAPVGVAEEDYREVAVRGKGDEEHLQVETPWQLSNNRIEDWYGRIGVEIVGLTKRLRIPSKPG